MRLVLRIQTLSTDKQNSAIAGLDEGRASAPSPVIGQYAKQHAPFHLSETSLSIGEEISVVRTSEALGWPNLNVSLTMGRSHEYEIAHRAINDLWINMALAPLDVSYIIDQRELHCAVPAHRMSIIAPETPVSVRRNRPTKVVHAFLKASILTEVAGELFNCDAKDFNVVSAYGFEDLGLAWLLRSLKRALFEPAAHSGLKIEYLSRALATDILCKHAIQGHRPRLPGQDQRLTNKQIRLISEYVRHHLSSEILLNDLAALVGISRTTFVRRFKSSFQTTPHQFLMQARVRRGQELLAKSDLCIAEIALVCGFADQAHFSTCFKYSVGMAPSTYRKGVC